MTTHDFMRGEVRPATTPSGLVGGRAGFLFFALLTLLLIPGCDLILGPNELPTASISSPSGGQVRPAGEPVEFEGSASDPEDGDLTGDALQWTSSLDGAIGSGTTVVVSDLSLGMHDVRLVATDSDGGADTAMVQVTVNASPSAEIVQPADGAVLNEGDQAFFEGEATDPEDGTLTGVSLLWTSDLNGVIGSGVTVRRTDLATGFHVIELTAVDSYGATAHDSIRIYVNPGPVVSIVEPEGGAAFDEGAEIEFRGEAEDEETGALDGSTFEWVSSVDGAFGTGATVRTSALSPGLHTITLTAADERGATGSATVRIVVGVTVLQNGEPEPGLGAGRGSQRHFKIDVPEGGDPLRLRFILTGGNGDADMYVRRGAPAGTGDDESDCESIYNGNEEECTCDDPEPGRWYVRLYGVSAYDGAILLAEVESEDGTCSPDSPDRDGDRLPDCVETDTGVFVDAQHTGTDPDEQDTDLDGLRDGDEVLGTLAGLDLPALGVSPLHKDILLEYDWFADDLDCDAHTHRPTAEALDMVTTMFADAPIQNPDGTTGIRMHHDYGQGGVFTGGNLINDADGVIDGGVGGSDFAGYKAANFALEREGYFHYVLMPHRYGTDSNSSGQAEVGFDDMIISLQCAATVDRYVARTIAHELGHNLTLRHGGNVALPNYKPNYNSVMNYLYQFPGVDADCTPSGDGVLDYSYGTRPSLDENDLDETDGICGAAEGPSWDWNGDGDTNDVGLQFDINVDHAGEGDGIFGVLTDFNDWAQVTLWTINLDDDGVALRAAPDIVSCTPVPAEWRTGEEKR